ncbi:MAG: hypothetical protein IJ538_02795 [Clostridia bacterium]|nr:hypothetical protein [Clostridia bacterium]
MKKLNVIFITLFVIFIASACGPIPKSFVSQKNEIDLTLAFKLENFSNENYSDETLKSLCVILKNDNNKPNIPENYFPSEKTIKILNSVKDKSILSKDVKILKDKKDLFWNKTIKKGEILKYLQSKNISLTNISNVKPNFNDGSFKSLNIGGKTLKSDEIIDNFNLPSNRITGIKNNSFSIEISGEINDNYFILNESESLSKEGKTSEEILKSFNL